MTDRPNIVPKGRYQLQYRGTECKNCGHPLDMSDKFCPNCSQLNSTKKLTLKDFFDEFFSSLISYDSKILKTLSALLLRPGKITKDYINGKRVSYTNPFRFLLSLAIIYFLMTNYSWNLTDIDRYGAKDESALLDKFSSWNLKLDGKEGAAVQQQLDSIKQIGGIEKALEEKRIADSLILTNPQKHFMGIEGSLFQRHSKKRDFFNIAILKDSIYRFDDAIQKYGTPETYENQFAFNSAKSIIRAKQQPGSFISALVSKLPFVIFFFLPVFALFIWLMYIRKKYNYTDHLIFSFHIQSLLLILLIISFVIDGLFEIFTGWIFILIFGGYLYKSMRNFYGEGRFKTIVKYIFLNSIFVILAMFSIILVLVGSMFTY